MNEQRTHFELKGDFTAGAPVGRDTREIWIGSDAACHVRLDEHFAISARHARIERDGENFYLIDADEAHVTFVNDREAEYNEPFALAEGDLLQIGPYLLKLKHERDVLRVEVTRLLVASTFVVERAESEKKNVLISWEGDVLLICNPPDQLTCGTSQDKLILNHPKVSPLHAGVSRFRDPLDPSVSRFYLVDLSPSNTTHLNGVLLRTDVPAAIPDGGVAHIGPFDLTFKINGATLHVVVVLSVTGGAVTPPAAEPPEATIEVGDGDAPAQVVANALRIFWAKRTREKAARRSPLQSSRQANVGKVRYKWRRTSDLARAWPFTLPLWFAVFPAVGFLLLLVFPGLKIFSPRPLSTAHASAAFNTQQPTARQTNANACTNCHVRGRRMDDQCASCHNVEGVFVATVTRSHAAAGVGCINCHSEHRSAEFRPGVAPFNANFQPGVEPDETCAGCHNDANTKLYNGRRVFTPHGGTFGYPVVNGHWKWKGIDEEAWQEKPEELKQVVANWPVAAADENVRRSAQFHALHLDRVRTDGTRVESPAGTLSCSSCHKTHGEMLDRATPRESCGKCHNGRADARTGRQLIAADQPDCISCHAQHVGDKRRRHVLLAVAPENGSRP